MQVDWQSIFGSQEKKEALFKPTTQIEPEEEKIDWSSIFGKAEPGTEPVLAPTKKPFLDKLKELGAKVLPGLEKMGGPKYTQAKMMLEKGVEQRLMKDMREAELAKVRPEMAPEVPTLTAMTEEMKRGYKTGESLQKYLWLYPPKVKKEAAGIFKDPKVNYYADIIADRLPLWLTATAGAPAIIALFEMITQVKNVTAALAEGSKYDPLANRQLSEFISEDMPEWFRVTATIGEGAFDMILAAILAKKIKFGMLKSTFKTRLDYAEKIGWDKDLVAVWRRALNDSVGDITKFRTLEQEIATMMKGTKGLGSPLERQLIKDISKRAGDPEAMRKMLGIGRIGPEITMAERIGQTTPRLMAPATRIATERGTIFDPKTPEAERLAAMYREVEPKPPETTVNINPQADGSVDVTLRKPTAEEPSPILYEKKDMLESVWATFEQHPRVLWKDLARYAEGNEEIATASEIAEYFESRGKEVLGKPKAKKVTVKEKKPVKYKDKLLQDINEIVGKIKPNPDYPRSDLMKILPLGMIGGKGDPAAKEMDIAAQLLGHKYPTIEGDVDLYDMLVARKKLPPTKEVAEKERVEAEYEEFKEKEKEKPVAAKTWKKVEEVLKPPEEKPLAPPLNPKQAAFYDKEGKKSGAKYPGYPKPDKLSSFKERDIVVDVFENKRYEVLGADKRGMGDIRNVETWEIKRTNYDANYRYISESELKSLEAPKVEKAVELQRYTPMARAIEKALKEKKPLTAEQKEFLKERGMYKEKEIVKPKPLPKPEKEEAPERMELIKVSIETPTGSVQDLGEIPADRLDAVKKYAKGLGVEGKLKVGKAYVGKWGEYLGPTEIETHMKTVIRDVKKVPKETWKSWEQVEKVEEDEIKELYAGIAPSKEFRQVAQRVLNYLQIEPQFRNEGAPETGLAVKLYHPIRNTENKRTATYIAPLNKLKLSDKDYQELPFIAARPGKFLPLSEEDRHKFSPAYRAVRKFFDDYEAKEKELGIIEEGWPLSAIKRMENEKIHINAILVKAKSPERRTKLKEQLEEIDTAIDFLTKSRIQYVHIPRIWMEKVWEKDPAQAPKILTQFFRERKTLDIEALGRWLLEKGFIEPKDLDIRRIMALYGHKVGHKIALAKIFKAAEKEGMIKDYDETLIRKGWTLPYVRKYPTLKGKMLHPVLSGVLEKYFFGKRGFMPPTLGKIFTYSKLLQFPNPLFLPMYDVYQSFWTGALTHWKTPAFMGRAIRSMIKKDSHYWDASDWGAFSTPYTPDFKTFDKEVKRLLETNTFMRYAKRYINPYHASWDMAWTGDNFIRMITYHYYRSKGFNPRWAAQLTAKPHGDYASIPPNTRRQLNKILFTPSFRIAMISAQSEMVGELGRLITREKKSLPTIKMKTKDGKTYERPDPNSKKYRKAMARIISGLVGSLLLQEAIMHKLGFKTDQWGLKYTKEIEVKGEKKELVYHLANPANVILRYWHRIKGLIEYDDPDKYLALLNRAKWEFHPLYQLGQELLSNRGVDFEPIWHPDDEPWKIWRDRAVYSLKRIVRMLEVIPGMEKEVGTRRAAYKALIKDLGATGAIMSAFGLPYLRNTKEQRLMYRWKKLMNLFKYYTDKKPFKTDEDFEKAIERLWEKIEEIQKELEELE